MAIVDVFDDPLAEADLAAYRSTFGLPPCTRVNRCFEKLNENGSAGPYPSTNAEWAYEISTDLDMVSAICPRCRIALIEADDNLIGDLARSQDTAVKIGATVVSNSFGVAEFSQESELDTHFNHPGIPVVAAAGDGTYNQAAYPAVSPYVISVGGTTLTRAENSRGWTETVADGTASGCASFERKPPWQRDAACPMRTANDVAAFYDTAASATSPVDAGAAVYDTFHPLGDPSTYEAIATGQLSPGGGWSQGGGTSAAAQIIAAVYALAGNGRHLLYGQSLYAHANRLFDITAGSNGDGTLPNFNSWPVQNVILHDCGNYLCRAGPGYDGPTGNGTPNGIGAF